MKRQFAIFVIKPQIRVGGYVLNPTGPAPAPKPTAVDALTALGAKFGLQTFTQDDLRAPESEMDLMCDVEWPINKVPRDLIMLVGGSPDDADHLKTVLGKLAGSWDFIVVRDALEKAAQLRPALVALNEGLVVEVEGVKHDLGRVQLAVLGELPALIKAPRLMVSAYPRADVTTTTVVIIDAGTPQARVLSIVRDRNPYKDCESLPGGFLNVHLEDLPQGSAREVGEECNLTVPVSELVLIDVRSSPDRDPRGHVVDHGYAWFVPADRKAEVLSSVKAGDDAKPGSAKFALVSEVLSRKIAFDHLDLLVAALKRVPAPVSPV
jgi:ADP-ribose pyrophosphatase YjhB (NUDIX family)